jgi:predicted amidohydrolase
MLRDKPFNVPEVKTHWSALAQTNAGKLPGAYLAANRDLAHAQKPGYFGNSYQCGHHGLIPASADAIFSKASLR